MFIYIGGHFKGVPGICRVCRVESCPTIRNFFPCPVIVGESLDMSSNIFSPYSIHCFRTYDRLSLYGQPIYSMIMELRE